MHKQEDTYSYKGWLTSDYFYKRALAVLGYEIAGQAMVWVALMAVAVVVMAFVAGVTLLIRISTG